MFITLKQAARILGIKTPTMRQQIKNGRLSGDKPERDWFITLDEVRRYARESQGRELGDVILIAHQRYTGMEGINEVTN